MKIKVTSNFSFQKLLNYVKSEKFNDYGGQVIFNPLASSSKKYIREGKVKPALRQKTIDARRARKTPKSIGGIKPLYDTGKLVNSVKYKKIGKERGLAMESYGEKHLKGYNWKGVKVPARKFLFFDKPEADKVSSKIVKNLRQAFRRRLAK